MLDENFKTAVRFHDQAVRTVTHGIPVDRVFDEEEASVGIVFIHGQGPEGIRRDSPRRDAPAIGLLAGQLIAFRIEIGVEIHGFLFAERRQPAE